MDADETGSETSRGLEARQSVWHEPTLAGESADHVFARLTSDLRVDVAIIGGGITGVSAAAQLMRAGRKVALLEAGTIGSGTTGHATGNLYATVDSRLHALARKWGRGKIAEVVKSRTAAVAMIERNVFEYGLDCAFERQPWVLYSIDALPAESDDIQAEYHAALEAGLDVRLALDLPMPYSIRKALVLRNQAQFNPLQYVRQLAAAVQSPECQLFEYAEVVGINEAAMQLRTSHHSVQADHIIMATHVPKGVNAVQTELGAYREYAVAASVEREQLPGGIFWSTGARPTSTRAVRIGGQAYILMVGEMHKTGQHADPGHCYRVLDATLRARFDVQATAFRWSAQHYRAADGLPYIGPVSRGSKLRYASGFGTDGLVYGTLAAMLLANDICGVDNAWAALYSPQRFTPIKSAKNFIRENLNVAGQYLKDYVQGAPVQELGCLLPGEGSLVEIDGSKVAAFRDESNRLQLLSPVCSHLKCIVHWNRAERSWDCPCHGSRFGVDGQVIEGPALQPLARYSPGARRVVESQE